MQAKFRHLAALIRFELAIEDAAKKVLAVWLPQVAAADNPEDTRKSWQDEADKILELIGGMWLARYLASGAPPENAPVLRSTYLAEVRRRLYEIPTRIFSKIAAIRSQGVVTGIGQAQIAEQVRQELNPKNPAFKDRSELIGRTEAISVYNAGNQAGFESLNPAEPLFKKWLSLHDHRVRPTHVVADGQVVPVMANFEVGGFVAKYPGDPSLPAREAVGCRCISVYGTAQELGGS